MFMRTAVSARAAGVAWRRATIGAAGARVADPDARRDMSMESSEMMETGALFPERDEIDAACAAGIAEACERLDCAHEWIADDGFEHQIVGGAVDGARVAWVEKRARSDGGWEDVEYRLRMRAGDVLVREWVVDTYNPHFGCDVGYLRWWG